MAKLKKGRLEEIVEELKGASKMHLKQSKEIESLFDQIEMSSKLESEILRKVGTDKKKTIVIRGHKDASYKNVMKVIDIAPRAVRFGALRGRSSK